MNMDNSKVLGVVLALLIGGIVGFAIHSVNSTDTASQTGLVRNTTGGIYTPTPTYPVPTSSKTATLGDIKSLISSTPGAYTTSIPPIVSREYSVISCPDVTGFVVVPWPGPNATSDDWSNWKALMLAYSQTGCVHLGTFTS